MMGALVPSNSPSSRCAHTSTKNVRLSTGSQAKTRRSTPQKRRGFQNLEVCALVSLVTGQCERSVVFTLISSIANGRSLGTRTINNFPVEDRHVHGDIGSRRRRMREDVGRKHNDIRELAHRQCSFCFFFE